MDHVANILDTIHPTLAHSVWEHPRAERPKLKRQHREWIIHTVQTVLEAYGYHQSDEWLSLVLTGSLTTYQYSDSSDCDVSLFVDAESFPEWSRGEIIGLMVEHVDGTTLPGTPYDMQCFVVPKGLAKEDLYRPGLRSGYDLEHDEWIVPPDPQRSLDIEHQRNEAYVYAMECADKMERLLRYDPERAEDYWHQIHAARRRAQQEGRGDLSLPNIVYKFLANRGLFPRLSELTGEYIAHTSVFFNDDQPSEYYDPEDPYEREQEALRQERLKFRAQPNVMYHVAPVGRRDAIRQRGLDPAAERINADSDHTPGVYLWEDPEVAMKYRSQGPNMHRDMDLHAVTVDRDRLKEDPWFNLNHQDRAADFPGAWYSEDPIPAENIHRFYPSAWHPWKTSALDHQAVLDANAGQSLQGLPGPVNVPGYGKLQFGAHAGIQQIANEYNAQHGLGPHPTDYQKVNPQHAAAVAQEYDRMAHNPQDPQVAAAYDALTKETRAQYDHAVKNGYQFEFYPSTHDPYPNSPREAVLDLHRNKHMYVYPTVEGFGSGDDHSDHPLMGDSGVRWSGKPVTHNDLFRAIHDFYGHAKEGLGFRADGEDNAYRQHAAMFSPLAQRALASETRGQNHWVNYGPHGEHNQTATSDTIYAPQKAGLLPEWASHPELHKTAKVAARFEDKPVAKFVYSPFENRLILGEMGKEEGEKPPHAALRQMAGIPPSHAHYGQIDPNGFVETFIRPQLGVIKGMSPYETDYRLKQALDEALPGVKFPEEVVVPPHHKWDLSGPPEVIFTGQKPVIRSEHNKEPSEEADPFGFTF